MPKPSKLIDLIATATNKPYFSEVNRYISFCKHYLEFVPDGLQAQIVSQNENHYLFYQYREDGHYNITRPLNSRLMLTPEEVPRLESDFVKILASVRDISSEDLSSREFFGRAIYTIQQSIGAVLDALPAGASNTARKINGDLFERFMQLLITAIGVDCKSGTVQVPVYLHGELQFAMKYQHDLLLSKNGELKVIGSVKTSSKDRIDKIFLDKFLYCRLTETAIPHIAIFLNDVQRKKTRRENEYGVSATFLPGHFKTFMIKLNPLDGVYYCDVRPNMTTDPLLSQHIRTIDHFFFTDVWTFLHGQGLSPEEAEVQADGLT